MIINLYTPCFLTHIIFLIYKKKGIMPHELNSDESVDGFGDDGFGDLQVERNGAEPTPSSTAEHGFPLLPESQENDAGHLNVADDGTPAVVRGKFKRAGVIAVEAAVRLESGPTDDDARTAQAAVALPALAKKVADAAREYRSGLRR